MAKCVVCVKPAPKGSVYCPRCLRLITLRNAYSRPKARFKAWYTGVEGSTALPAANGSPGGWRLDFERRKKDRTSALVGWASMIRRMKLDTGDNEFNGVVRRLADA